MTQSARPLLLSNLTHCKTSEELLVALRNIKHYITGHELRKTEFVHAGVIPSLATLLQQVESRTQASHAKESRTQTSHTKSKFSSEVWSEIANIICVIASAGPKFVTPLLDGDVVSSLLARLSFEPSAHHLLAILRCLNAIVDNLPLARRESWNPDRRLADLIYTEEHVRNFTSLIQRAYESYGAYQVYEQVLVLICKTCSEGRRRSILVHAGVLSALCERLTAFVIAEGYVTPGQNPNDPAHDLSLSAISPPAIASLSYILETLAAVAESSRTFSKQILDHPAVLTVFPTHATQFSPSDIKKTPWGGAYLAGSAVPRPHSTALFDDLLPRLPEAEEDSAEQSNFPTLSAAGAVPKRRSSSVRPTVERPVITAPKGTSSEQDDGLFIPWLLWMARSNHGRRRLACCRLLTNFYKHGLVKPSRSRTFGILLVPVLVSMMADVVSDQDARALLPTGMLYTEAAPHVLSRLIEDNQEMQKITVQADAVRTLAEALKSTFEQSFSQHTTLWQPYKKVLLPQPSTGACVLGSGGPTRAARHNMTYREGILQALASIAPDNDDYRKEICDKGALVHIVLSLEPFQNEPQIHQDTSSNSQMVGNSTSTLLAACSAVRALTRSVTALRTRLVDAEVGNAVVKLMYNSDPEVRVAATKVIANLAMDFSPLKSTISEPELVKKLCEQVHSANAQLRLESIWALKLLALNAPDSLKIEVIDELGPNWITQLIKTDPYDIPPGEVIGLSDKDYPPRSTTRPERDTGDVIMSEDSDDDVSTSESFQSASDEGSDFNKHTVEDDLEIQEQLIDLIRNLFCGESALRVVEYLLGEIGPEKFMAILLKRLQPKVVPGPTRRGNQRTAAPKGIVVKCLYVIVHIAASAPKYRFLVCNNHALMQEVANFSHHEDPKIRVQCAWVVINLTYESEQSDQEGCRDRALVLHRLGFFAHMRRLEHDVEPDVRERAKTAVHLLEEWTRPVS